MPFYSGLGLTTDIQVSTIPKYPRTIIDLFVAIMLENTLYINPFTKKRGTILDLLEYICLQKRHTNKNEIVLFNTEKFSPGTIESFFSTIKKNISSVINPKHLNQHQEKLIITDNIKNHKLSIKNKAKAHAFIGSGFLYSIQTNRNLVQ